MSATSASPAEVAGNDQATRTILVWDAPVRVFHWLMVACFAGAWITAESEYWRLAHVTFGYTMAGLVLFRLVWGLIGTRYARFSNWVHGPRVVAGYVLAMLRGKPAHYTGHNPLGAVAIVLMLMLTSAIAASGWATYNDLAGGWLEDFHEAAATFMLAVVGIHVAGVAFSSWMHRENLVAAMVHGRKEGHPHDGVRRAWRMVAAIMLTVVLGFWWIQWNSAPIATTDRPAASVKHDKPGRHRD